VFGSAGWSSVIARVHVTLFFSGILLQERRDTVILIFATQQSENGPGSRESVPPTPKHVMSPRMAGDGP
jgi:hypothetical protein